MKTESTTPDQPACPRELFPWDWPDTEQIPDGYDMTSAPKLTEENFRRLINEHNKLLEFVRSKLAP